MEQPRNNGEELKEEIRVKATELVEKVKALVAEGNVRKVIVSKENGERIFEIPLTAGVIAGGAITLIAPVLAGLGAMAALLSDVRVQVIRTDRDRLPPEKDADRQ
jgi:hypothetical protein